MSEEAAANTISTHERDDIVSSSPASTPSSSPGVRVAPNRLGGDEAEKTSEFSDETTSRIARFESLSETPDHERDDEFRDFHAEIYRAQREILSRQKKVATELDVNPRQSQPEREALEQESHALGLKLRQLGEQSRLKRLQKMNELQLLDAKEESECSTALELVEQLICALISKREDLRLAQEKYVVNNVEIRSLQHELLAGRSE